MHFHLPKPLHGWREFAGEVGIIVIGVCIALGAEQVVETIHWKNEVSEFRTSINHEVAENLGSYEYRMKQNRCVEARLSELEIWLDGWRKGGPETLLGPISGPITLSLHTAVWGSRDPRVMAHMPLDTRLTYATIYDEAANIEVHRLDEREAWLELSEYDGSSELDHRDLMRLRGLITRARLRNQRIASNAVGTLKCAEDIGIRPHWSPAWPALTRDVCKPIIAGIASAERPGSRS